MPETTSTTIPAPVTGPEAPKTEPARPEFLQEKFKTVEDQARAYVELEKLIGKKQPETTPAPSTKQTTETKTPVAPTNETIDAYAKEFEQNGSLSDASYQKLQEQHGLNRQFVDNYIAGQQAREVQFTSAIHNTVGGEQQYGQMIQWASANMTPAEINVFNNALNSRDVNAATLAVQGLQAKFSAANGVEPKLVGGSNTMDGIAPFTSVAEMTAAMSDKKYKTDELYRSQVEKRLAKSSIF